MREPLKAVVVRNNQIRMCPLYDNGSSLCSYIDEQNIDSYLGKDQVRLLEERFLERRKNMSIKDGRDYIYLIWKEVETRRQYTVGQLSKNGQYEFNYGFEVDAAIKKCILDIFLDTIKLRKRSPVNIDAIPK